MARVVHAKVLRGTPHWLSMRATCSAEAGEIEKEGL
jgi:hypothetical protein